MSRHLILAIVIATGGTAAADKVEVTPEAPSPPVQTPTETPPPVPTTVTAEPAPAPAAPATAITAMAPADMSDQGIGAELGVATGGRVTPGGLRVSGHYLYQLSDQDWFDGVAGFTFGGGTAACFRDRMDAYICSHGLAQGDEVEVAATVRHFIGGKGDFWPFLRGGVGLGVVHFGSDDVTGVVIPLHVGAGLRVKVAPSVAITAEAVLDLGFGAFNHTLGIEPQLGAVITAGAEFRL